MEPTEEAGVEKGSREKPGLGPVVHIDEERIQSHLGEVVRTTVEETLNALLDAEADHLCGARKYERSEGRKDTRAGSYDRRLQTKAGEVKLTVPKLRTLPFETAIIERYRRRESSVEEALIEMYLAGVSVRRVEDITQALVGRRSEERLGVDRHRSGADRLPGDSGRERRSQGGRTQLDGVPARVEAARVEGRATLRIGQVSGAGGEPGRVLPGSEMAALRGSFLSQRVDGGAEG